MKGYKPPYTVTDRMISLVSDISEKLGKLSFQGELESKPHLRRNNQIQSIHSSLKIEANSLSLEEVRDVINGHPVYGDPKEISEVKNAYRSYEKISEIDPYSDKDLKRIHGIMTENIIAESGTYRKGEEGVFSGNTCIFIAPPPYMVDGLMKDLFGWMKRNRKKVHPLILSAVFHYEFVFIHPFADGNGRMARLWHTVLLYQWKSVFQYIPLESQIEKYQSEYYEAIMKCNRSGRSDVFIEFILEMIDQVLEDLLQRVKTSDEETSEYVKRLLGVMEYDVPYTASEIMKMLGLKSKETFRKNYIHPAIKLNMIRMTLPNKPNSKNQRYIRM